MAITTLGRLPAFPQLHFINNNTASRQLNASTTLAATVFMAHKSANITAVTFVVNGVAGTGGTVRARLMNIDASGNPDTGGTIHATESQAVGSTGEKTITFSSPFSVTAGNLYALVLDNTDGAPATNNVTVRLSFTGNAAMCFPYAADFVASWAKSAGGLPCICPKYSDEYVAGVFPGFSGNDTVSFKQDTGTADEYALAFTVPAEIQSDGAEIQINATSASADFLILFIEDSTTLDSIAIDASYLGVTGSNRRIMVKWGAVRTLTTGKTYRISIQPNQTAANVTLSYCVFGSAASRDATFGSAVYLSRRLDGGAWTDFNSGADVRVPQIWPTFIGIETGGGGSSRPFFPFNQSVIG